MEKSVLAMKKEMAEMKSTFEKRNKELEKQLKEVNATLKMERETSEAMIEGYKDSLDNVRKENGELIEQMEGIALESMMKERSNLMKDFLVGKAVTWEPEKWIEEYDRLVAGISSSDDGDVEGNGEDVESKEIGEEIKEVEGAIGEDAGKEKEDVGRMEVESAEPLPEVPASDVNVAEESILEDVVPQNQL